MGLLNESDGGGNFLQVLYGNIVRKVPAGTEGAEQRTNKNGKVVHELKYNALEGVLKKIWVYESTDYQDSWVFVLDDGKQEYNLTVPYSSSYANGILGRLPNVNFERPIKVKSYYIEGEDGKQRGYLTIHQDGEKVQPYFTKEEPHGLPPMEEVIISGKKRWDDTARLEFLRKMVDEKVNPKLAELYPVDNVEEEVLIEDKEEEGVDDLPFIITIMVSVGSGGFLASQILTSLPWGSFL